MQHVHAKSETWTASRSKSKKGRTPNRARARHRTRPRTAVVRAQHQIQGWLLHYPVHQIQTWPLQYPVGLPYRQSQRVPSRTHRLPKSTPPHQPMQDAPGSKRQRWKCLPQRSERRCASRIFAVTLTNSPRHGSIHVPVAGATPSNDTSGPSGNSTSRRAAGSQHRTESQLLTSLLRLLGGDAVPLVSLRSSNL